MFGHDVANVRDLLQQLHILFGLLLVQTVIEEHHLRVFNYLMSSLDEGSENSAFSEFVAE